MHCRDTYRSCIYYYFDHCTVPHLYRQDKSDALETTDDRPEQDEAIARVDEHDATARVFPGRTIYGQLASNLERTEKKSSARRQTVGNRSLWSIAQLSRCMCQKMKKK